MDFGKAFNRVGCAREVQLGGKESNMGEGKKEGILEGRGNKIRRKGKKREFLSTQQALPPLMGCFTARKHSNLLSDEREREMELGRVRGRVCVWGGGSNEFSFSTEIEIALLFKTLPCVHLNAQERLGKLVRERWRN